MRIALAVGATSNLLALTAILVDGPTSLAITCTAAAALTAGAARHTIRAISREPQPESPTA